MPTPRESGAKLFRREFDLDAGSPGGSPVIKLSDLILGEAILNGATSIRLEKMDDEKGGVSYEIDGAWRSVMVIPIQAFAPLINRFKVMASLDISRQPSQAGEVHLRHKGIAHVLDIRTELKDSWETVTLTRHVASA